MKGNEIYICSRWNTWLLKEDQPQSLLNWTWLFFCFCSLWYFNSDRHIRINPPISPWATFHRGSSQWRLPTLVILRIQNLINLSYLGKGSIIRIVNGCREAIRPVSYRFLSFFFLSFIRRHRFKRKERNDLGVFRPPCFFFFS